MEIYVLINNETHGPYTQEQIQEHLKTGGLQGVELAAYAGRADWKPLSVMVQAWDKSPITKTKKPRPDKPRTKVQVVVIVGVLLVGGTAAGFFWWRNFSKVAVETKVTTPIEPGFPNTLAELNKWYQEPPEGQNAAKFFQQGFDAMQISDADRSSNDLPLFGKGTLPAPGSRFSPKSKTAVAALVQRNKSAREAFQKAITLDQCRYPIELTQGFATLLPHLSKLRATAQLSELTAILMAENKLPKEAVGALLISLAAGQSLKDEPCNVSQSVSVGCIRTFNDGFERVLSLTTLPSSDLKRLNEAITRFDTEGAFTRACVGERATILSLLNLSPDELEKTLREKFFDGRLIHKDTGDPTEDLAFKRFTKNLKSQRVFAEETYNRMLAMRKLSFPERLKIDAYLIGRVAEAKTNDFRLPWNLFGDGYVWTPASREATGLVNLRLAQTAIAIEFFRAANSHYPDALTEISPQFLPAVPTDPFNGQPVAYRQSADGYELSSTGSKAEKPITFTVKFRTAATKTTGAVQASP
jgi:hypothetical protein